MKTMTAGVTKEADAIDGISWNLLGQIYRPKQYSENSFAWEATFPPGTFVPPHIHTNQDEFIYVLDGRYDLVLDGQEQVAVRGDLVRMPMGSPHGIFNKTDGTNRAMFWVAPSRRLWELFAAIHNVDDPEAVARISAGYDIEFLPPPQ